MLMISAVITSLNEGEKLKKCLKSLKNFPDEVIVVDLESNDHTKEIAKSFGAKIFTHKRVDYVEKVRNFGISKANGEWVLILDPDEEITEELISRLNQVVSENKFVAVNIPRKNIFFNTWISHTNWWPDRHIRFFKKNQVSWNEKIHSYPKVDGDVLNLEAKGNLAIVHFGYTTIREFFDRQNRYSSIEAENRFNQGEKFTFKTLLWFPLREFLARYIKHRGFMDGFYGFALVYLMMIYQLAVWIKVWEKEQKAKK